MVRSVVLTLGLFATASCGSVSPEASRAPLGRPVETTGRVAWLEPLADSARPPDVAAAPFGVAIASDTPAGAPPARRSRCNEQSPDERLVRSSYRWSAKISAEERATRKALHRRAIEYRTRQYGHVEGFGEPSWNRLEPKDYAKSAKFMGIGVKMNVRVLSALSCVEDDIVAECSATPYAPRMLDTFRTKNTFHDNEVSNHLYGIAIDIDPDKNSCCGCVTPGAHWSKCDEKGLDAYERTALPRCWIDAFERYGFYWLGHDPDLEDTMHFEFLADPDHIVKHVEATASR
ncbi:MAG TPA: M15 family metallopeptidase [Polyangiaceae bacterium]|nr:M15 family metallopeptidase [Polyangiaceae bacterium]